MKRGVDTVIVGAGPYGLSLAAHLQSHGASYQIFGKPMDFWMSHMPEGMSLKSDGFASNLYDPSRKLTLERYCETRGIAYADIGVPVHLDTFVNYGLAFADTFAPNIDKRMVVGVDRVGSEFRVEVEEGEVLTAQNVVVAVGIAPFAHIPPAIAGLPSSLVSHSSQYREYGHFAGRKVAIVGGGASAIDLAILLHERGAEPVLLSRRNFFRFNEKPPVSKFSTSVWDQLRSPLSGIGPGWRNKIFGDAPWAVHYLPESLRAEIFRRSHGASGGWFCKEKIETEIQVLYGYQVQSAAALDGKLEICLHPSSSDSLRAEEKIVVDHLIAATGYKLDVGKLDFLSDRSRSQLDTFEGAPRLNSRLESSTPGLFFVGALAGPSFGPVLRFAFGAGFTSQRLSRVLG